MRDRRRAKRGYTLIELLLVIALIAIVSSIFLPRFDLILQNAAQATARGNLAQNKTAINIYYSSHQEWPFNKMPDGWTPSPGSESLTSLMVPQFFSALRPPRLVDRMNSFNGLPTGRSYDDTAAANMSLPTPKDVYILRSPPNYTPLVDTPFVFNPDDGTLTYSNGNYDTGGRYFYTW